MHPKCKKDASCGGENPRCVLGLRFPNWAPGQSRAVGSRMGTIMVSGWIDDGERSSQTDRNRIVGMGVTEAVAVIESES